MKTGIRMAVAMVAAGMEKRPGGHAQLRGHRPGSRCAYRQRLVALDGGQYRQQRLFAARWRGR